MQVAAHDLSTPATTTMAKHRHHLPRQWVQQREDRRALGSVDELGIEHGGIKDAPYGSGLAFRDPDGIALEFFAPARCGVSLRRLRPPEHPATRVAA